MIPPEDPTPPTSGAEDSIAIQTLEGLCENSNPHLRLEAAKQLLQHEIALAYLELDRENASHRRTSLGGSITGRLPQHIDPQKP